MKTTIGKLLFWAGIVLMLWLLVNLGHGCVRTSIEWHAREPDEFWKSFRWLIFWTVAAVLMGAGAVLRLMSEKDDKE